MTITGYLKCGDIQGESVEPNHKGWINFLHVNFEVERPMPDGAIGATRHRTTATLRDIACVTEVDKATPKLKEAMCRGISFPEVEIHLITSSDGQQRTPYYTIKLKRVFVTDMFFLAGTPAEIPDVILVSGVQGAVVPTVRYAFNYEEIEWIYDQLDKDNKSHGKLMARWKVEDARRHPRQEDDIQAVQLGNRP